MAAAGSTFSTQMDYDYMFKVLIIGESGVGKSSLLLRFADDTFTDTYISTIGVDFKFKTFAVGAKNVKLQVWDTAGQERFRTITTSFYRGAHGVILAFDVTDMPSFYRVNNWLADCRRYSMDRKVPILLVGTKCDLTNYRVVPTEMAADFARQHGMTYLEASAKANINVTEAFHKLASIMIDEHIKWKNRLENGNGTGSISDTEKLDLKKKKKLEKDRSCGCTIL